MPDSLLSMAKELTVAQIQAGHITPEHLPTVLHSIYETLSKLKATDEPPAPAVDAIASTDWKQSITQHAVICLECGVAFKQLSRKHLSHHNLDAYSYRDKFGIPRDQPLVARKTQARRREIAKQVKPWERTRRVKPS